MRALLALPLLLLFCASADALLFRFIRGRATSPSICWPGSKSFTNVGADTVRIPVGCWSITIDVRSGGGGGGGGGDDQEIFSSMPGCPGSVGGDSYISRGETKLAQAGGGDSGGAGPGYPDYGAPNTPHGTDIYAGLTLTPYAGGAAGAGGNPNGGPGTAGYKVSGVLPVINGETLNVYVGDGGAGGCNSGDPGFSDGAPGTKGSITISWGD